MSDWVRLGSGLIVPEGVARAARRPTCIDLFCGCGGFSLGLLDAGWEVLAGVDNDFPASYTYLVNLGSWPMHMEFIEPDDEERFDRELRRAWAWGKKDKGPSKEPDLPGTGYIKGHPDTPPVRNFFFGDIRKLTGERLLKVLGKKVGEVNCIVGGPPCQGFSIAGKRNVMDPRNSLVFEFIRLVLEIRPHAFCMENVPGIASMVTPEGVPVVDAMCLMLEKGGFGQWEALKKSLLISSGSGLAVTGKQIGSGNRVDEDEEDEELQPALFGGLTP